MCSRQVTTDLVLIGGGHSHVIALKLWATNPIPNVRVTLITDTTHTPYSGMLPGYVAGFYNYDEIHIDLRRLASCAQIQLYLDQAIQLDLNQNRVICKHLPPVNFDYLSLDIGSNPSTLNITGGAEYAIAAKPVPQFLTAWNKILEQVKNKPNIPISITIVGGGAGGVELALNMQLHLQKLTSKLSFHLFHSGTSLLSGHNYFVSQRVEHILRNRGVKLYLKEKVKEIVPKEDLSAILPIKELNSLLFSPAKQEYIPYEIRCESGLNIMSNVVFLVTQAAAPTWIKTAGLTTDAQGFILVKDTLQSVSHPHIFAAGDIATMENYIRPKAGVFAVRQGKPLWENLQRIILGKPLKNYLPQKQYLSLIGTGDKSAIASWSGLGLQSPLLWYWKDYIDRQFMAQFSELPEKFSYT
jgi:selenide,water dikinase